MTAVDQETLLEFRCNKCWHSNFAPVCQCGQTLACAICSAEILVPEATPERIERAETLCQQAALASKPPHTKSSASKPSASNSLAAENPYRTSYSSQEILGTINDSPTGGINFSNAPLATLVSRLVAYLVDGVINAVAMVCGVALIVAANHFGLVESGTADNIQLDVLVISMFPLLAINIIQWNLIATRGQSLGKMLMFIRIVCMDGNPPGFICGVVLRSWVTHLLAMIPFFGLLDIAFIFTDSRRCLHDYLGGTRVVHA